MGLFHWEEAFQAKTLYDPLLCSPIACACLNSCVVLGDVVVRLRQETKDYQGLKNSSQDVDGIAWLWSPKVLRNFFLRGLLVYISCLFLFVIGKH